MLNEHMLIWFNKTHYLLDEFPQYIILQMYRQSLLIWILFSFLRPPSARYFLHAFSQFRWGVFQEYAEEGESEFYISFKSAYPEAIRCVYGIKGLIQINNSSPVEPCYPSMFL